MYKNSSLKSTGCILYGFAKVFGAYTYLWYNNLEQNTLLDVGTGVTGAFLSRAAYLPITAEIIMPTCILFFTHQTLQIINDDRANQDSFIIR